LVKKKALYKGIKLPDVGNGIMSSLKPGMAPRKGGGYSPISSP